MKKIFLAICTLTTLLFSGCIKNEPVVFDSAKVEFDAATWNANAVGVTYPILTRIPVYGAATGSGAPSITRSSGTITVRVNLLGSQKSSATSFTYTVDAAASTAIAGTHFTTLSGTGSIPANSSFGFIDIPVLNPGATSGSRILVLQLTDNASVKASVNYAKVGLSISQL